jgi:hypothetical protein
MPKLPKRLPYEFLIVAALALSSCSRPAWEDKLDVADVNARNAIDRINALESRVDEIESKLNM